ncbi:flavodoxin family protein [Streptococcus vicugnae]|uniref:Flavodoxin family protein n=1 Tax=Streptococcus vicugnae TaxID=2740579 RepID=A0A4R5G3A5_9STRE|nr:NAD(P)H-dependent oxidoreductase [Streptococcus vicugnae]TDE70169.1 flavodoxin family protein [Streptococcus vicugnae]
MDTLIIYSHPYDKSFNHAILENVEGELMQKEQHFNLVDLYKDHFNPAYTSEELALFKDGGTTDPLVVQYQKFLTNANHVIFIFPIWWNDTPAMIKGFIDKVMKKKFAYEVGKTGVVGHLTHIEKATILTTSTSPTWYLKLFCGNAIKKVFINATLKQLGINHITWQNMGNIDKSTAQDRQNFLNKIDL